MSIILELRDKNDPLTYTPQDQILQSIWDLFLNSLVCILNPVVLLLWKVECYFCTYLLIPGIRRNISSEQCYQC